jgi:amidase
LATTDHLSRVDAIGQAELVRSKHVSAVELVRAAIARIEAVNPTVNAVVTPLFEEADRKSTRLNSSHCD